MRRPGLQRAVGIRHRAAGVVVSVELDIAMHHPAQRAHQFVNLHRVGDAHGIGDAHAVDANLVHRAVDGQQVDQVAAEAVLAAEAHLQAVALHIFDHFLRRVDDIGDVLAVRELTQIAAGAEQHVDAVCAGLDGDARIVHMAAHMRQNLGLQAQLSDALNVEPALGAGYWRRQFQVLHAKRIEQFGNLHLLIAGEERVGKLLALSQRRLNDRKVIQTHGMRS